ncbi:MAG: histidinol-phosphatase HisJ family protein [Thermoleophilaceae bacterium]
MLTDYHVHLRPDDDGTTAERYFTRANADVYREAASGRGIGELGVAEHVHRFAQSLDVWQHPWYRHWAHDDLDAYCEFVREETDLRLGIEADFLPGREEQVAELLDGRDWDYVLGSLHFLRDQALDIREGPWAEFDIWRSNDPDEVWARYFETLGEAARSGLFDILSHPDLVKVWGSPLPEGDLRRFYERAMEGIEASDVAIEVSTAGLRKPVREIYPARGFLELCLEVGRPVALSSDAHLPEHLGWEYERAVDWLGEIGVEEIAVFDRRSRRLEKLG